MIKTRRARQIMITQHTRTYTNIQAIYFDCLASIYRETTKNIDSTNQSGLRRRSPIAVFPLWPCFMINQSKDSSFGRWEVSIPQKNLFELRKTSSRDLFEYDIYRSLCNTKYSYTHFATLTVSKITTISISIILFIFYYLQIIENK